MTPTPSQVARDDWYWLRLAGALLLLGFAGFHVWLHWPALFGREAWLERAQSFAPGVGLGVAVLLVLWAHTFAEVRASWPDHGRPRVSFSLVASLLLSAFSIYHLTQVWPPPDGAVATLDRSYQRLWEQLGQPVVLGCYVLGCGALTCYVSLLAVRVVRGRVSRGLVRMALGALGIVLFLSYLQLLARFAAGAPLLPIALLERDAHSVIPLHSRHASDAGGRRQHVS